MQARQLLFRCYHTRAHGFTLWLFVKTIHPSLHPSMNQSIHQSLCLSPPSSSSSFMSPPPPLPPPPPPTTSSDAARGDLNSILPKRSHLSPVLEEDSSEIEIKYYRYESKSSSRFFNGVHSSLRDRWATTVQPIVVSPSTLLNHTKQNSFDMQRRKQQQQQQQQHQQQNDKLDIVDPYQVLQVRRDATHSEIRQSYRRLSLWHHPGRSVKASVQERFHRKQTFAILAACLETLLNAHTRRRCDVLLRDMEVMRKTNLQHYWAGVGEVRVGGRRLLGGHQISSSSSSSSSSVSSFDKRFSNPPPLSPASSCSSEEEEEEDGDGDADADDNKVLPVQEDTVQQGNALASKPTRQCQTKRKQSKLKKNTPPVHILTCCNALNDDDGQDYHFSPGSTTNSWNLYNNKSTSRSSRRQQQQQQQQQQQVTSLLNNNTTSSSENSTDIHYTHVETTRLFGGPLQLLYRARRWKPFTDPFKIFAKIFGSNVSMGDGIPCITTLSSEKKNMATTTTTNQQQGHYYRLPSPRHATAVSGTAERLPNGTTIFRKTRLLPDRSITRTEIVRVDPRTGKKHATVTVTTQELPQSTPTNNDNSMLPTALDCLSRDICSIFHWPIESEKQYHQQQQQQQQRQLQQLDRENKQLDLSQHWGGEYEQRQDDDDDDDNNNNNNGSDNVDSVWCFTTTCQSWLPVCT